ncbi:MAG: hypothetical protein R6X13_00850 [bacterium]
MTHRLIALAMFACLYILPGCGPEDYNSGDPYLRDHHEHPLVLHFRTINHAADTLGTTSVVLNYGVKFARRHQGEKLTRSEVIIGTLPDSIQFVYPDSGVHTCTTTIEHYVGYQLEYGGDTTRYGEMDRYGPWSLQFDLRRSTATFASGDSVQVYGGGLDIVDMVPDTVRPNGILELDVIVDLNGLLVWRQHLERYYLNSDCVHVVTQR